MPQGKLKVKSKLPSNIKNKKKKGPAVSKRSNKPIQPKKHKIQEAQKIKKIVSKNVNHAVEEEMRLRAADGKKTFSKVEQAFAEQNMKKAANDT